MQSELTDVDQMARELLVALRGDRSQVQWSRRLGYRSNVAYTWEKGRRWPTAAETFRACERNYIDVSAALVRFYGKEPGWLSEHQPATPEGVAAFLDDLRGNRSVSDLAKRAGLGRSRVSRWLSGDTQPRLPDFLRLAEAASLRVVDLLAALVDPRQQPTLLPLWERREARRNGAIRLPWTQALVRCLELEAYRALPAHQSGWIAARLGISEEHEQECLAFLHDTGQIAFDGQRYVQQPIAVDNQPSPELWRLRKHWTEVAAQRIEAERPGQFSFNVFTCSREDFERIRAAHLSYFRQMRAIVGESQPGEVVGVVNVQLFALE